MNVTFVTFNITGRQTTMIPKFLQNVKYLYIAFIKHLWMIQLEIEKNEFIYNVRHLRKDLLLQARRYFDNTEDAEDAVQETLAKLWVAKNNIFDAGKMRNMASVVCRNVSLNMLRKAKCTLSLEDAGVIAVHDNPQVKMEESEDLCKLERSIHALSDKQRAILRMRNVENISYADIAKIIGTSESSVRGMISKARKELLRNMKGIEL